MLDRLHLQYRGRHGETSKVADEMCGAEHISAAIWGCVRRGGEAASSARRCQRKMPGYGDQTPVMKGVGEALLVWKNVSLGLGLPWD